MLRAFVLIALLQVRVVGWAQTVPVIVSHPTSMAVLDGADALFNVAVSGAGPLAYQWQLNGTNLPSDMVITVAGNGATNHLGDGGLGTEAGLNRPFGVVLDRVGNLYVADFGNHRVRKVSPEGIITTVAGNGNAGYAGDGGKATVASLFNPAGVAVDEMGNLYISDYSNNRIRKVDANGVITTFAGDGTCAFAGDDGLAVNASLCHPFGLFINSIGSIYVADNDNYRIRRIDTNGVITTVAGGGFFQQFDPGTAATNVGMVNPTGVALDAVGNMYIADNNCNRVLKVDTNGIVSLFAGTGSYIFSGDGGPAVDAGISYPRGVAVDDQGNVFIAVFYDNRIRKVDTNGIITTVAGSGETGYSRDNISAAEASFLEPQGVAVAPNGNLYIADSSHNRVREVVYAGPVLKLTNVTTNAAGDYSVVVTNAFGSVTSQVASLTVNVPVYFVDEPQNRQVLTGGMTTFAAICGGTPPLSYQWQYNGSDLLGATRSEFSISVVSTNDAGDYAVVITNAYGAVTSRVAILDVVLPPSIMTGPADQTVILGGRALLSVTASGPGPYWYQWRLNGTNLPNGIITTIAGNGTGILSGDGGYADKAGVAEPNALAMDGRGNLYIAATGNQRIRKVGPDGIISTVAGKSPSGYSGDGGPATNASLNNPRGVAVDAVGNVYIADFGNNRVRKISTNGIISTVAGNGSITFAGDGGSATNAGVSGPSFLALDLVGNLLFSEKGRVRQVAPDGIITTITGNGIGGFSGDNGAATNAILQYPIGIAVDSFNGVLIADWGNHRIRRIGPDGLINTIAGNGTTSLSGDGGLATNAGLKNPRGVAVHPNGNIYIADTPHATIRCVGTNGIISPVAGTGWASYSGDGGPATNATLREPASVAIDPSGNLLIADTGNNRVRKVLLQGPTLVLDPLTAVNGGDYDVIVANQYASVTSSVAKLKIALPTLSISTTPQRSTCVQFSGVPGKPYLLQCSTNLAKPIFWQTVYSNLAAIDGIWSFVETNQSTTPAQFYRVTVP